VDRAHEKFEAASLLTIGDFIFITHDGSGSLRNASSHLASDESAIYSYSKGVTALERAIKSNDV
jgi:hypothetical protein